MVFGFGKKPVDYGGYVSEDEAKVAAKQRPQSEYDKMVEEEKQAIIQQREQEKLIKLGERAHRDAEYKLMPKGQKFVKKVQQVGEKARQITEGMDKVQGAMGKMGLGAYNNPFGSDVDYLKMFDPERIYGNYGSQPVPQEKPASKMPAKVKEKDFGATYERMFSNITEQNKQAAKRMKEAEIERQYNISLSSGKEYDPIAQGHDDLFGIFDRRSSHARRTDLAKKTKTVFTNPFDPNIYRWMKDPDRYDVKGIDAPRRKR